MVSSSKKIAITGGTGQIAYSLLFPLANGDLFGQNQPIELNIIDLPEMESALRAIKMELEDCAYPLLQKIRIGSDPFELFKDADCVFLIGARRREAGMERKDLLIENGKIFVDQGRALNEAASPNARILVLGNPCNTNCLIAMHHAPRIARRQFHAMMRLDHNRAKHLLAEKANVEVSKVNHVIIWGNHSSTQVPDFTNVTIAGKPYGEKIPDRDWLQGEFFELVQKRGASIIAARGKSSAGSAAQAGIDAMRALFEPTQDWFSSAVSSEKNTYGIDDNLIFGFPCQWHKDKGYEIVPHLEWDFFIREKIAITQKELIEERNAIQHLLKT